MANWQTEFPDFDNGPIAAMLIAAGWQDASWRNEPSPCFHAGRNVIWIDYAAPDRREFPDASGYFTGSINDAGGYADDVDGHDSLHDALSSCYIHAIGYAPFADDPGQSPFTVATILAEHADECAAHGCL